MIGEILAGGRKQLLEHPAHREHGRTAVDQRRTDRDLPHLAANRRAALENSDIQSACCECERGDQTGHACTDDDDTISGHVRAGSAYAIDMCQYLFTFTIDKSN